MCPPRALHSVCGAPSHILRSVFLQGMVSSWWMPVCHMVCYVWLVGCWTFRCFPGFLHHKCWRDKCAHTEILVRSYFLGINSCTWSFSRLSITCCQLALQTGTWPPPFHQPCPGVPVPLAFVSRADDVTTFCQLERRKTVSCLKKDLHYFNCTASFIEGALLNISSTSWIPSALNCLFPTHLSLQTVDTRLTSFPQGCFTGTIQGIQNKHWSKGKHVNGFLTKIPVWFQLPKEASHWYIPIWVFSYTKFSLTCKFCSSLIAYSLAHKAHWSFSTLQTCHSFHRSHPVLPFLVLLTHISSSHSLLLLSY